MPRDDQPLLHPDRLLILINIILGLYIYITCPPASFPWQRRFHEHRAYTSALLTVKVGLPIGGGDPGRSRAGLPDRHPDRSPTLRLQGSICHATLGFGEVVRVLCQSTGDRDQPGPWGIAASPTWADHPGRVAADGVFHGAVGAQEQRIISTDHLHHFAGDHRPPARLFQPSLRFPGGRAFGHFDWMKRPPRPWAFIPPTTRYDLQHGALLPGSPGPCCPCDRLYQSARLYLPSGRGDSWSSPSSRPAKSSGDPVFGALFPDRHARNAPGLKQNTLSLIYGTILVS